jgi:hypothetical protein
MRTLSSVLIALLSLAACGEHKDAPQSPSSIAAADIDKPSPLDKSYRLKEGEALDVDRLFRLFPLYLRPTYDEVSFDRKLGATVVANLKFGAADEEGFTAKRAEFYGVDVDRLERIEAAESASPDAPMGLVLAKLRLFGIESVGGGRAKTTIGAVEIDSLRMREGGIPKDPPGSGLAAFFNAFDVAGVYLKDVKAAGEDDGNGAGVEFSAKDLRVVGLAGGRLKAFLARDMEYLISQSPDAIAAATRGAGPMADILLNGPLRNFIAPENQRMRLKSLEWRDISFAGLMPYALKGERPPVAARDLLDFGTARIVDAETLIGAKRFSIVPTTEISAMEFSWLAPSKVRAVTRGGLYDFTAYVSDEEKEAVAALKSRKLDAVKGDSDFAYDWNPERGGAVLSTGFDSEGFADFDLDVALEGLELAKIEAARAAGGRQPALELARLKSFSAIVEDEQLLDAFYALSAIETGETEREIRAATPALLRVAKVGFERESPRIAGYIEAVADFLEDGGALEVKAQPEAPVPLNAIAAAAQGGPEAMADAVNLTVVRKE